MKLNIFLFNLLFMCIGSSYGATEGQTMELYRSGNMSSAVDFIVTRDVTNKGGAISLTSDIKAPAGEVQFASPVIYFQGNYFNGRWTSSSPLVEGAYDPANVNTGDTVTVGGKKYYRLKNIQRTSIPMYIRVEQEIWLPSGSKYEYVEIPELYTRTTGSEGWYEFNVNWVWNGATTVAQCNGMDGNYNANVTCNQFLTFTLSKEYNNRNVKIFFYMPRTPSATIEIPRMKVGQSVIHNMCMDPGDGEYDYRLAKSCTHKSPTTPLVEYYIQGLMTFTTSCNMSETTKTVNFAPLSTTKLAGKGVGEIPDGFTPVQTTVTLTCKNDINSAFLNGVEWSITGAGSSLSSAAAQQGILLASGTGVKDLGVKITRDLLGKNLVKVDGSQTVPAAISGTRATATFYSYPTVANASKAPSGAGDYQATATLTFDMP